MMGFMRTNMAHIQRLSQSRPLSRSSTKSFKSFDDSAFKPDGDVLSDISELISITTEISSSEGEAATKLSRLLSTILGKTSWKTESVGGRIPDGLVFKELEQILIPLICFEYRRAFGEEGCDPITQAEFSLREFLVSNKVYGFRMFSRLY